MALFKTKKLHHVLLVDDEEEILKSLQKLIEKALPQVAVSVAPDAEQAYQKLSKQSFDVVVSDYRMPGENGLAFLTTVQKNYPDMARIMITAHPDIELAMDAAMQAGTDNFLVKPLEPASLIKSISTLLA